MATGLHNHALLLAAGPLKSLISKNNSKTFQGSNGAGH